MQPHHLLLENYCSLLNQHYQLLSEGRTGAVGVLSAATVLSLEQKIRELREESTRHCLEG